jgi:hypothetical protein
VIAEDDRPYLTTDEAVIPHDEVNFHPQWQALAASGVPYERHYLPDILSRPELQRFKVYVFLENAYISIKDRAAIRSKLLNAGRTAIWVYNSGLVSEDGRSDAAMSDLIGIRIVAGTKAAHRTTILDIPGLRPHAAASEFLALIFNNGAPGVEPFHVIDDTATLLGHHAETGEVAVASKRQDGWNSVYIGSAQGLTDDLLNYLARQAGAYVAGPPGQMLHLSGEFASIHTLRSGDYTLTPPPGRARIVDAFTGEVLASGPNPYTFPVEVGRTYWFLFE